MEIRKGSRHNTGTNLTKSMSKKHNTVKISPSSIKKYEPFDKNLRDGLNFKSHPASKYIRNTYPTKNEFKKFITLFYRGLYYSINNLKGPSEEFIRKKSVALPEPKSR